MCGILLLGAFLFLPSCAPSQTITQVTPSSYRESFETVPRTVGKLRRLVMMSVIQPAPPVCTERNIEQFTQRSQDKINEAYYLLSERKGYEIVPIVSAAYEAKAQIPAGRLAEYSSHFLAEWARKSDADAVPPDVIKRIIDAVGSPVQADGVVVLHAMQTCFAAEHPTLRGLAAIFSLGTTEIPGNPDTFKALPEFVITICERHSGRIVWKNTSSRVESERFWRPTKHGSDMELLFNSLENAVPKVLTR